MTPYPRRRHSSFSPPWKPQILQTCRCVAMAFSLLFSHCIIPIFMRHVAYLLTGHLVYRLLRILCSGCQELEGRRIWRRGRRQPCDLIRLILFFQNKERNIFSQCLTNYVQRHDLFRNGYIYIYVYIYIYIYSRFRDFGTSWR
jgi:hypothetical protein